MQSQKLTGVGKLGQIQNMNSIVDSIWPVLPDNAKELIKNVPFRAKHHDKIGTETSSNG